jgi:hypothetical protein
MVENMVSQPAIRKQMAVRARSYMQICWNPLNDATQVFQKLIASYFHPTLALSPFPAFYPPSQFSILLSPSDQDSHFLVKKCIQK